jgi:hypothetical protein
MPIKRLITDGVFEPKQIAAMTLAYEQVLQRLGLVDRDDPLTEIVAKKIIKLAKRGELDPGILCEKALADLDHSGQRSA